MESETYHIIPNTSVAIAPSFGCNLFAWIIDGQPLLYFPQPLPQLDVAFFVGGNPILFPSVGRTWDRSREEPIANAYRIHGHADVFEMPVHGLGLLAEWVKRREHVSEELACIEYVQLIPAEVRAKHYPFDVELSITYRVSARKIEMEACVRNQGAKAAPFALGFHPHFKIARKEDVEVFLPCTKQVILDHNLLIPVDEVPFEEPKFYLESDRRYNAVFTGVDGPCASITDTNAGWRIRIHTNDMIEAFVLSAKPGMPHVCVEPWTKGLGNYERLAKADWQDGGYLNVLKPGETRTIEVAYSFETVG
jgi:galactose mutarotase-like enzyme